MSSEQIVNAPNLYVDGLQLSWVSNTSLSVTSGACRDHTNTYDFFVSAASTTINAATVGLNGLDQGALAASTSYAVYLIGDPQLFQPTGFLLSSSFTSPLLPFNYGAFRRIGVAVTNSSSQLLPFIRFGSGQIRDHRYAIGQTAGGVLNSTTVASVNLNPWVPASFSTIAYLTVTQTSSTAGNAFSLYEFSSVGPMFSYIASVTGVDSTNQASVPCISSGGNTVVRYAVSAGQGRLFVQGFVDYL